MGRRIGKAGHKKDTKKHPAKPREMEQGKRSGFRVLKYGVYPFLHEHVGVLGAW